MNIYVMNMNLLTYITIGALIIWGIMLAKFKRISKIMALIGTVIAVYAVLSYTMIGRTPSSTHTFAFFSSNKYEFKREMFMNVLLYVPFGMMISALVGSWTVLIAFILSLLIEIWQYKMGTGLAQGTDVIMNTIGALIGSLPCFIVKYIKTKV